MTDTLTPNYTKEELDSAKKELEQLTPEDLLNIKTRLSIAEDAVILPEAPSVAFMELRAPSGSKINLTVRAVSGQRAIDALAQAVAYARERYSMSTTGQPTSTAPLPMTEPPHEEYLPPLEGDIPPAVITNAPPMVTIAASAPYSAAQPTSVQGAPQPTLVDIAVESITRERKRDGKGDFLRVRGGKFGRYGVPCYAEKFPQGLDVSKMQYGIEFTQIPDFMKHATVVDEKPYHVVIFHS